MDFPAFLSFFPRCFFFFRKTEMCFYESENGVMTDEIGGCFT